MVKTRVTAADLGIDPVDPDGDIVVTLPRGRLKEWIDEGDAAGDPPTGGHWAFHMGGKPPKKTQPGNRVYVVYDGRLIGYAPLVRVDADVQGTGFNLVRAGDAQAVTIDEPCPGFRGYRYRWWPREAERPFPDWRKLAQAGGNGKIVVGADELVSGLHDMQDQLLEMAKDQDLAQQQEQGQAFEQEQAQELAQEQVQPTAPQAPQKWAGRRRTWAGAYPRFNRHGDSDQAIRIPAEEVARAPQVLGPETYQPATGVTQSHPHTDGAVPGKPVPANEQVTWQGGDYYRQVASNWGTVTPGENTDLQFYDYRPLAGAIQNLARQYGFEVYEAGGKYGKPDLESRNYGTGHLMIYDPTPGEGGDFGDEEYTRAWRTIHELAHGLTHAELNEKWGERRRLGKLGWQRSINDAKRAVEWEWLAAHKQRELGEQLGYQVDDATFAHELNTVMHDAVHRAITGKFTNPDQEGFMPSDTVVPLEVALAQIDQAGAEIGLTDPDAVLTPQQKSEIRRRKRRMRTAQADAQWWHGSPRSDIEQFTTQTRPHTEYVPVEVPLFITQDKAFGALHATGPSGTMYQVEIPQGLNTFTSDLLLSVQDPKYWPPEDEALSSLGLELREALWSGELFADGTEDGDAYFKAALNEQWDFMESNPMMAWLRSKGFDAFRIRGDQERGAWSLAVFDPTAVRIVDREPQQRQASDDPAKRRIEWRGLTIAIEVPGGEVRYPGDKYETYVPEDWIGYGYFEGLPADDGDSLDAIVGPGEFSEVYLAIQKDIETGKFVQFKVMLGFDSEASAAAAYRVMWPAEMFGGITRIPIEEFRDIVLDKLVVDEPAPPPQGRDEDAEAQPAPGSDDPTGKDEASQDVFEVSAQTNYFEDRPPEEQARLLAESEAALEAIGQMSFPVEGTFGRGHPEPVTILGPTYRFPPYTAAPTLQGNNQLLVERPDGSRFIAMAPSLFVDGKPLRPKSPQRRPVPFFTRSEKGAQQRTAASVVGQTCPHCGEVMFESDIFGRGDRWFHRPCVSEGPFDKGAEKAPATWILESLDPNTLSQIPGPTVQSLISALARGYEDAYGRKPFAPVEEGQRFAWSTLGGERFEGKVLELDGNVVIVACDDGEVRATDLYEWERQRMARTVTAQQLTTFGELELGAAFMPVKGEVKGVAKKTSDSTYSLLGKTWPAEAGDAVMRLGSKAAFAGEQREWKAGETALHSSGTKVKIIRKEERESGGGLSMYLVEFLESDRKGHRVPASPSALRPVSEGWDKGRKATWTERLMHVAWRRSAGRLEDALAKYPDVATLVSALAAADPSGNQKYLDWAARQVATAVRERGPWIGKVTVDELAPLLKLFHKRRNQLEKKDINQYANYTELQLALEDTKATKSELKASAEYDKVYSDDAVDVYQIKNKEASCMLGAGTDWCISKYEHDHYEDYTKRGIDFMFMLGKQQVNPSSLADIATMLNQAVQMTYGEDYTAIQPGLDKLGKAYQADVPKRKVFERGLNALEKAVQAAPPPRGGQALNEDIARARMFLTQAFPEPEKIAVVKYPDGSTQFYDQRDNQVDESRIPKAFLPGLAAAMPERSTERIEIFYGVQGDEIRFGARTYAEVVDWAHDDPTSEVDQWGLEIWSGKVEPGVLRAAEESKDYTWLDRTDIQDINPVDHINPEDVRKPEAPAAPAPAPVEEPAPVVEVTNDETRTAAGLVDVGALVSEIAGPLGPVISSVTADFDASTLEAGSELDLVPFAREVMMQVGAVELPLTVFDATRDLLDVPEAQELFEQVRIRLRLGSGTYFRAGEISLDLGPLLFRGLTRPGTDLTSDLAETLSHELRHAADWAYRTAGGTSFGDEAAQDLGSESYYNEPTELYSYAGNVAERVWMGKGPGWRELSGQEIVDYARRQMPSVMRKLRPENFQDFMTRVVKGLEQIERLHRSGKVVVSAEELEREAAIRKRLPPKEQLWNMLLDSSRLEYPADFVNEDARYKKWLNTYAHQRGAKPVYEGGETDSINSYLSLEGDQRVSGPYEGFLLLTRGMRTWHELASSDALRVLGEVPGLEGIHLPESVMDRLLDEEQAAYWEAYEDAPAPTWADEQVMNERPIGEDEELPEDAEDWPFVARRVASMRRGRLVVQAKDLVPPQKRVGYLREGKQPGEKAVVVLRVPSALARSFPAELEEMNGPPHFTLAYIPGPHSEEDRERLLLTVNLLADSTPPIPVELAKGVDWFTTDNEEKANREIAHKNVHPKTAERMAEFHWALVEALEKAGFKPSVRDDFKAHATLGYMPERSYSGPVPEGGWTADAVEIWGWPDTYGFSLGGERQRPDFAMAASVAVPTYVRAGEDVLGEGKKRARQARVAKDLEAALSGMKMRVTAAGTIVIDLNPPGTFSPSPRKKKDWAGETYYVRDDDGRGTVAYTTPDAVPSDDGEVREVRLEPAARVLREGSADWLNMFEEGLPSLVDVVRKAVEEGYDAVRIGEALAILSGVALAEQDDELKRKRRQERKKQRGGWMRA